MPDRICHCLSVAEFRVVVELHVPARAVRFVVVRQVLEGERTVARGQQVAKVIAQLQPALAHVARVERQVIVRREVQVVRDRNVETRAIALADRRCQEAAFAFVVQREGEVRGVQDRHALERELHAVRRADAAVDVEVDVARMQLPRRVLRGACREQHLYQRHLAAAGNQDFVRRASRGAFRDVEARALDANGLCLGVDLGVFAVHGEVRSVEAHAAEHLDVAVLVGGVLGRDRAVAILDLDLAGELRLLVVADVDVARVDLDRSGGVRVGRRSCGGALRRQLDELRCGRQAKVLSRRLPRQTEDEPKRADRTVAHCRGEVRLR